MLAAKTVFATSGYDGAKTLQIAHAAGVSEALVFRHFPSKAALYRAVLRRTIEEQDATLALFGRIEPSASGMADTIVRTVQLALQGAAAHNSDGMRLVFGSLAGDGHYARLVYRRAKRLILPQMRAALAAAAACGDLREPALDAENASNFIEHVISMLQVMRRGETSVVRYNGGDTALMMDTVRFCARGIGLSEPVIEAALAKARPVTQAAPRLRG